MHHEFYQLAKKIIETDSVNQLALATVVHVRGSAYRREGTRMIIGTNGKWHGNISGGCLEGDILRKAKQVIETGESILVTYDTRESKNKEIRVALGCNGVIDILIEAVKKPLFDLSQSLTSLFEKEKTGFLITEIQLVKDRINVSRKLSKKEPAEFPELAFNKENYCQVEKSEFKITLYEYIGLQRKLVIWGAGPDIFPLAQFAIQLGWKTIVASDCGIDELRSQLTGAEIYQSNFEDFNAKTSPHKNTAIVLVSHDFYKDYFILETIIQKNLKYIGIMGPKRRGERMIQEFRKRNPDIKFTDSKLHYPIGLDIGSDNPTEIALSIIAEVQSAFSGKDAAPLKDKTTPIHNTHSEEINEDYNPNDSICTINYFQ